MKSITIGLKARIAEMGVGEVIEASRDFYATQTVRGYASELSLRMGRRYQTRTTKEGTTLIYRAS